MPTSYGMRGEILHGQSGFTEEQVDEAVDTADDLLRRSLLAVIAREDAVDWVALANPIKASGAQG